MWVGVGFAEGGCAVIPFRETEAGSGTGDGVGFFEIEVSTIKSTKHEDRAKGTRTDVTEAASTSECFLALFAGWGWSSGATWTLDSSMSTFVPW